MNGKPSLQTGRVFTALMMALFVIILLALTMFGARIFASTYSLKTCSDADRLGLSLLANLVHANDAADALGSMAGPEGDVLVLAEHTQNGDFETRLYAYQGKVVEEYALADSELAPENATPLVESQSFSFSYDKELLTMNTDQGSSSVALRSSQGGARK